MTLISNLEYDRMRAERDDARAKMVDLERDLEMRRSLGRIDQTRVETIARERDDARAIARRLADVLDAMRISWVPTTSKDGFLHADAVRELAALYALPWAQDD